MVFVGVRLVLARLGAAEYATVTQLYRSTRRDARGAVELGEIS